MTEETQYKGNVFYGQSEGEGVHGLYRVEVLGREVLESGVNYVLRVLEVVREHPFIPGHEPEDKIECRGIEERFDSGIVRILSFA